MRVVHTDASFRDGVAGLAGVVSGVGAARVLFMDVVVCGNSNVAERMALEKAMAIARRAGWDRVVFRVDLEGLRPRDRFEPGWRRESVPRRRNVAAHTVAREVLKVWFAAREGAGTVEEAA